MTNFTDADGWVIPENMPEAIWATPPVRGYIGSYLGFEPREGGRSVKYIRAEPAEPTWTTAAEGEALETCGKCMGSGYGGHPDSGALCHDCNGTGGVPRRAELAPAADSLIHKLYDGPSDDPHPLTREEVEIIARAFLYLQGEHRRLRESYTALYAIASPDGTL